MSTRSPLAPAGTRIYAIGDIHGCIELLAELHRAIGADVQGCAAQRRVMVYVGDYIDRGPDSKSVIELVSSRPLAGFETVCLAGNHEEMMLDFLDDVAAAPRWYFNGGNETLSSYGVDSSAALRTGSGLAEMQQNLARNLPASHLAFLRALLPSHVEGDYMFVHAGILPGCPLAEQDRADLLWIRGEFLSSDADHGGCVVHGHTIVGEAEIHPNRIAIDTGAFASGRLTCLVLEGDERRFLHT
jgi:serine/threonine protein phosphatase 1